MTRRHRTRKASSGPLLALGFVLATASGCGALPDLHTRPSDPDPPPASAGADASDQVEQARAFAQCMRDNGVPDFPDPHPDGTFSHDQFLSGDIAAIQTTFRENCQDRWPNR